MRKKINKNEDEDLDKLDWDLEAGGDIDFEDEFGYEDEEESKDAETNSFYKNEKFNGKKPW